MSKESVKYIVGIDFGHGETSAAIAELPVNSNNVPSVKDLDLRPGVIVIPSAIAIAEDGNAYIGETAFDLEQLSSNIRQYVCFKQKPQDLCGDNEQAMIRFMKEVYKAIRENDVAELTDDNHQVYIAIPSGWDSASRDLYKQMAQSAGLPCFGVTKESRAALIYARAEGGSKVTKNDENGIVIFDMGSSTLDFTYMSKNSRPVDHGYDVGASNVEQIIYKEKIQNTEVGQKFEQKYPNLAALLLFKARLLKEEYFKNSDKKVKKTINFDDLIDDDDFEDGRIKINYGTGELEKSLSENGYVKKIECALNDFVDKILPENSKINAVLMTGGASRMDFLKESIARCWSVKENKIFRDTDPSLTISRGIAEVGRMDFLLPNSNDILKQLEEFKENGKISEAFLNAFSLQLLKKIIATLDNSLIEFRNREENCSLDDLKVELSENMRACVGNVNDDISVCMKEIIEKECGELLGQIKKIVAAYKSQLDSCDDSTIGLNDDVFNFDTSKLTESIADELVKKGEFDSFLENNIINGVIAGIAYLLLRLLGFWGLVISGVIALGKAIFGHENPEEKKKKAMKLLLKKSQQEKVYKSYIEKKDELHNGVAEIIREKITNNSSLKKDVDDAVYNIFDIYERNLKQARVLVE